MFVPRLPKSHDTKASPEKMPAVAGFKMSQQNPSHQQISLRAFEIYQSGGCIPDQDQHDWFQAEQEMLTLPKT